MTGVNRFRSVSLTQNLPITSARSGKSDSFNNSIDDLVTFLESLNQIKNELDSELLLATTPKDSVMTHNVKLRLKEITNSIEQVEKRLKVLQHIEEHTESVPQPQPQPQATGNGKEPYSSSQRSRSTTISTFGSGENFQKSIDSIRFTNVPLSLNHHGLISAPQIYSVLNASSTAVVTENGIGGGSSQTTLPLIKNSSASTTGGSPQASKNSSRGDSLYLTHNNNESSDSVVNNNADSSPTWLLSDILQSINSNKDQDEYFLVSRGNDLVVLLSQYSQIKKDLVVKTFISKIMFMLSHQILEVRATGYRIARHIITDYESLTVLVKSKILIFIIITLARSNCETEKEHALKLIREFLNIPRGATNLSIGVVKGIIAIIESDTEDLNTNAEDEQKFITFKNICIETLLEISLVKTELVFLSGGFRTILQVIQDGPLDLAISGILCLLQILDSSETRLFLRDGLDLASLISIFSDIDGDFKPEDPLEKHIYLRKAQSTIPAFSPVKLQRSAFLICTFLKNWNGLMSFSHQDFESWKVLVSTLRRPNNQAKDIVLDIILDVLRIKPLPWVKNSSIGDVILKFQKASGFSSGNFMAYRTLDEESLEFSILNHYIGLILDILVNKCNIMEVLLNVIEENRNNDITKKATDLISNIYMLSYKLLPKELIKSEKLLLRDTTIIKPLSENINGLTFPSPISTSDVKKYVSTISIESRYNMDEVELKDKLAKTKVLSEKEFSEWNWVQLSEFIQGPMRNPKKFEEIMKNYPKFLFRLMSFYRPFKFRFSNIKTSTHSTSNTHKSKRRQQNELFYQVGCNFFDALLSTNEGMKYLSNNKIIPQISESFAQLDPFSGIKANEAILSSKRLKSTLSFGYISFIGIFSKYNFGIKLLSQYQFFNIFHGILEGSVYNKDSQHLIYLLLAKLDYVIDSPLRIILAKALTICSNEIKVFIIESLLIEKLLKIPECERWVMNLLVLKLYDGNDLITDLVIDTLITYCNISESNLKYVITLKPSINVLLKRASQTGKGESLIMKFLSTSEGFKYLEEIGYIDKEFKQWVSHKSQDFSTMVSLKLEESMFPYIVRSSGNATNTLPLNFFSYLLQTEEGLLYFQQFTNKQFLDNLVTETDLIKKEIENRFNGVSTPLQLDDENIIFQIQAMLTKLKENLWILGNIASSTYGIQLLDSEYSRTLTVPVIPLIIDLVSNFPFWHVRGVAFYQLGRIASTIEGTEILDELNWVLSFDRFDRPCSLTYPNGENRLKQVFKTEVRNPYSDIKYFTVFGTNGPNNGIDIDIDENDNENEDFVDQSIVSDNNGDTYLSEEEVLKYHNRVLTLINHLSAVLGKIERKASKELLILKQTIPELYSSPNLFFKVIKLVDKGKYKLRVRRFIFSLFLDAKILETLARKEKRLR